MTFHTALGLAPIAYTGLVNGTLYRYTLAVRNGYTVASVEGIVPAGPSPSMGQVIVREHGHGDDVARYVGSL